MDTIQVHGINTDLYNFTIAFQKSNVKSKHRIINMKNTRILKIPFSLVLVDMFQNEVLTPFEEIDKVCHDDLRTLLAWDIISMFGTLVSQKPVSFRSTTHLLLAAASLEKINDLPQLYLDKVFDEIDTYEKGTLKLEDSMYAGFMIEEVHAHVELFFKGYLLCLNPKGRAMCIRHIQNIYQYLAHTHVVKIPNITYRPEVFDV